MSQSPEASADNEEQPKHNAAWSRASRVAAALLVAILLAIGGLLTTRWVEEASLGSAVSGAGSAREVAELVVGKDLKKLPESTRQVVLDAFRELTGKDVYWRRPGDGSPHRLMHYPSGDVRWVLVATYEGRSVAATSWMAVHLFDEHWQQVAVQRFRTGYRIVLMNVWQAQVEHVDSPVIAVKLGSFGSFGNWTYRQLQYYAISGTRPVLLRKQVENGELERAIYTDTPPWNGPAVPTRSHEEWIEMLASDDPVTLLEALVWLGATRRDEPPPDSPRTASKGNSAIERWQAVLQDRRTKERLTALSTSENGWVREAAQLAVKKE